MFVGWVSILIVGLILGKKYENLILFPESVDLSLLIRFGLGKSVPARTIKTRKTHINNSFRIYCVDSDDDCSRSIFIDSQCNINASSLNIESKNEMNSIQIDLENEFLHEKPSYEIKVINSCEETLRAYKFENKNNDLEKEKESDQQD